MILCVDVGNTTIRLGFYLNSLSTSATINADLSKSSDEYFSIFSTITEKRKINVLDVSLIVYCSVVPSINIDVKGALFELFTNAKLLEVNSEINTGLSLKIDNPKELGNDLIADLVSTKQKYGYPSIIIDLGTATKVLVIDKNGDFISALIIPGLVLSASSLYAKAALLPEVDLESPKSVLDGKNTIDSVKSGVVWAHLEGITGIVNRIEKMLGYKLKKIVTGGNSVYLKNLLTEEYTIDNNLALDGLFIIANNNKR